MAKAKKLPVGYGYGYGPAAPAKGAAYAKKGRVRRRAARILRRKKGSYIAFVKSWLKANPGKTIADAAKAWREKKA